MCRPLPPYSPPPPSGWTTWPAHTAGQSAAHQARGEEMKNSSTGDFHNNRLSLFLSLSLPPSLSLPLSLSYSPSVPPSPLPLPHPWIDVFDGVVLPPEVENIVLLHILFIQCL